jgi:ABC-type antimicrobial peptide transport system permease subunit
MQSNSLPSKNALVFGSGIALSIFGFVLGGIIGSGIGFVAGLAMGERYYFYKKSQNEILRRIENLEKKVAEIQDSD